MLLICGASRAVNEFKSEFLAPATPPNAAELFSAREISTGAFQPRGIFFGFSRTGPILDDAINAALDSLKRQAKLGEGRGGIGLLS